MVLVAPGRLFWKFFLGNSLIIAAVLATCFWLMIDSMDRARANEVRRRLCADAQTFRLLLAKDFNPAGASGLNQTVRQLTAGSTEHIRITAILPSGKVLADSEADPATMEPHGDRKEIREALALGWGEDSRISHTLSMRMCYVATRVGPAEHPTGVIRVAMAQGTLDEQNRLNRRLLWTIAGIGLLASLALALALARLWSRPIRLITDTARSISRGDLSARVHISGSDELAVLARSLNDMRDHLAAQLETIDGQRRTLQSLIAQLHEGVVVADASRRVVLVNPASLRLLGVPRGAGPARALEGRAIEDCVPNPELQSLLTADATRDPGVHQENVQQVRIETRTEEGELVLLARASEIILPGRSNDSDDGAAPPPLFGRLLVLTDVTDLSRMMQMKADFAANASHELRTPLSAVRAAVETLLQIDLARDVESARHFLGVADRHSSRLEALVTDLLSLSKLESSPGLFQPETLPLSDLISDLRARFEERIVAKSLVWHVESPPTLNTMYVNPHLLRLVLDNLIENAIKFTDIGGQLRLSFRGQDVQNQGAVVIEVSDTGCGIPEEEQARVFERFYQVERARSGAARGTGLGLSIVRHAVAAMKGTVELQSRLGEGTTITIILPQPSHENVPEDFVTRMA
jgi:two-component system phosphate regulon sensor histidine kinase PhoR